MLAALILHNDSIISAIRRELRRVVDVLVDGAEIVKALSAEVAKCDLQEGPQAEQAERRVTRTKPKVVRAIGNGTSTMPEKGNAEALGAPLAVG